MTALAQCTRQHMRSATTGARFASTAASSPSPSHPPFFPVQASPSGSVRQTPKPPSHLWYTARPTLNATVESLERNLVQSRAYLFRQGLLRSIDPDALTSAASSPEIDAHAAQTVLAHPRERKWRVPDDMKTYLGTDGPLKARQYRRLTGILSKLEGLLPHARIADRLADNLATSGTPRLVLDPVALASGRALSGSDPELVDSVKGNAGEGLHAQIENLLERFRKVEVGGTQDRVVGKQRRLGKVDAYGRVYATGGRKEASAMVWIIPAAVSQPSADDAAVDPPIGRIIVNDRPFSSYFTLDAHRQNLVRPLSLTQTVGFFNIFVIVHGSGSAAQSEAVANGLAKAVAEWERVEYEAGRRPEPETTYRDILDRAGLIRRDPRAVERKKPGHVKSRKMPTWVKR
ncbi:30S ribosomal protein s9 [Rhodotorula toruloides]|uniref:30S ribosomal protein s9 n=1 Tax=Rhodotorula toruloides TaxID=5286 RepID=A0A511KEX3_RHOTO|nr:30S ribosomal protein s9 [Rhodotorula toruloides]